MSEIQNELPVEENQLEGLKVQAEALSEQPISKAQVDAAKDEAKELAMAAAGSAKTVVRSITGAVKMFFPGAEVDEAAATEFENDLAAVLEKHGFHVGGAYQEEVSLMVSGAFFGFGIYSAVKMQIMAAQAAAEAEAVPSGA